jgi:hypothetical protein
VCPQKIPIGIFRGSTENDSISSTVILTAPAVKSLSKYSRHRETLAS